MGNHLVAESLSQAYSRVHITPHLDMNVPNLSWYVISSAQKTVFSLLTRAVCRAVCHKRRDVISHSWQCLHHVHTVSPPQPTLSNSPCSFIFQRPAGVIIHRLLPRRRSKCKVKDGRVILPPQCYSFCVADLQQCNKKDDAQFFFNLCLSLFFCLSTPISSQGSGFLVLMSALTEIVI